MTDEENDEIRMTKLEGMTRLRQGFGVAGPPSPASARQANDQMTNYRGCRFLVIPRG